MSGFPTTAWTLGARSAVRTLHGNLDEAMKEDSDQQADLIRIPDS
jgi:hypothetical protein